MDILAELQWGRTFSSAERMALQFLWLAGSACFNGAALFQVRKGDGIVVTKEDYFKASMGPHFFKCGKTAISSELWTSWPSFNGAALFQVRKVNYESSTLGKSAPASMGPHFFKCGKSPISPSPAFNGVASMGPHFFKCGKRGRKALWQTANHQLQWGRTFSSAESGLRACRGNDRR